MAEDSSAIYPLLVSREQAENALGNALKLYVGRGRRYSIKQLSNATGVKDRAIECAKEASGSIDYRPLNLGQILSLMKFLGPEFTNELMRLIDQVAIEKPEGIDFDEVADGALAYVSTHLAARHPNSPEGIVISSQEAVDLAKQAARLQAVTA